jgi:hypothetical protein
MLIRFRKKVDRELPVEVDKNIDVAIDELYDGVSSIQ